MFPKGDGDIRGKVSGEREEDRQVTFDRSQQGPVNPEKFPSEDTTENREQRIPPVLLGTQCVYPFDGSI